MGIGVSYRVNQISIVYEHRHVIREPYCVSDNLGSVVRKKVREVVLSLTV